MFIDKIDIPYRSWLL